VTLNPRLGPAALAAALVAGWSGTAAAAKVVEEGGYKYVQISLTGLWGGFFVFLAGIAFCLVGLFLFVAWRRSTRRATEPLAAEGQEEDDGRVF
jgi:hypothetical protein